MKLAIIRDTQPGAGATLASGRTATAPGARGRRAAGGGPAGAAAGASWLRFGDEVVYFGDGARWGRFIDAARRSAAPLSEHPADVDEGRLHLVVQKGRLFQAEHPDVRVIVDKGRYLLVEMDPRRATDADCGHVPCYTIRPVAGLGRNRAVFSTRAPAGAAAPAGRRTRARAPDPAVKALVDRVSRQSFASDLARLVGFPTRLSTGQGYRDAAAFAGEQFAALGYAVRRQAITVEGSASLNVIAERRGSGPSPRGVVLVSAHLDSINSQGGPAAPAPGADDDASGSAGVIEIARALAGERGRDDLRFVLFGGEEQGLFGSRHHAARMTAAQRKQVRAVVHMDMIARRNTPRPAVLLEGAPVSTAAIDGLAAAAAAFTTLAVQTSPHAANSDHVSFIERGVPAVLTIEGADDANDDIHSARDTLDKIDFELAVQILRMNTAFVATLLRQA